MPGGPGGPGTPGNENPGGTPSGTPGTPGTPGGTPGTPGTENPGTPGTPGTPGGVPPVKPKGKPRPSGLKEITNLLPGNAVSVWHLRMDELSRTPLYASVFDRPTQELFLTSMTFPASEVDEILHCYVGADKDAFAIVRTKRELDTDEMTKRLDLEVPKNNEVKGRAFYLLKSNAFLTAIGKSLSLGSVLGVEGKPKARPAKADDRKLAFNVYDSRTIVVADVFVMERFLNDLKEDGLPPFKSELTEPPPPPANPNPAGPGGQMGMPTGPGGPGIPMMPPMGPGGPGKGSTDAAAPRGAGRSEDAQTPAPKPGGPGAPPMGGPMPLPGGPMPLPGGPMTPGGNAPPPVRKSFTSNPYFRTIDPELKKALNTLEDEEKDTPAAVYVQKVDQRPLGDLDLRALGLPELADGILVNWLQQVKVLGFSVTALGKAKGVATGYFEYLTDDDAKKSVNEHVVPVLNALKALYYIQTRETVAVRDLTQGGNNQPGTPMYPGGPTIPGGNPMFPGPGGPGGLTPITPGGPGGPGGSGKEPESRAPLRPGSTGDDAQSPRPLPGGEGSPGGPYPAPPGATPPYPGGPGGPGGVPYPGGPGGTPGQAGSRIDVSLSDTVVSVQFEIEWQETTYLSVVMPGLGRMTAQLKGRMSVLSGENDAFALGASLTKYVKEKGSFPKGTLERDANPARFGLPHPPEQRVSLFAELLPYLGKAGLRTSIQDKKFAWYAKENLPAAEAWVPEFLVPYYDQSAWRATHELAEGRSLGATNYVGVAGLGLDAARYDPKDPAVQKKMGMYGYDWTSRPEEVTDGLSNTVALMQVPPGYQRPWIAGGGATLAGIDDRAEKPLQPYVTRLPDGTRGTTVLMGDGSVRTVRETINPALLKAMMTRAGGESLEDFDKAAPLVPRPKKTTDLATTPAPVSSVKPPVVPKDVDAEELKKLQGRWKPVRFVDGGKSKSAAELPKDGAELRIEGTTFTFVTKRGEEASTVTRLDPAAAPRQLDLKAPKDEALLTVYEFDGDRKFRIKMEDPGKPRPTTIKDPTESEKNIRLMEFEKID